MEDEEDFNEPFNWRVFIGPKFYFNWLTEQRRKDAEEADVQGRPTP